VRYVLRGSAAIVVVLAAIPWWVTPAAHAAARSQQTQQAGAAHGLQQLLSPRIPGVAEAGGKLYLNGTQHFFSGINAYSATTDWSVNWGCGTMLPDLNTLFDAVPAGSLVRTWAFQALGFNKLTHKTDFSAIDRVVAAAKAHHDYLVFALSDQAGTCDDGHFHNAAWYAGGYNRTYDDNGRGYATTMSYLKWVKTVVTRYKGNHTVAIYEPVNEPEASNCNAGLTGSACFGHNTCPSNATSVLRTFFDTVGRAIKTISPSALVSTGVIGGTQCGIAGTGFRTVSASKYVDITTFHDYTAAKPAMPSTLLARIRLAAGLSKSFLFDEAGINGTTSGSGCASLANRAAAFVAKAKAAHKAGADGYVPWNFAPTPSATCSYDIAPGDPMLAG
jgi:mannan endo-1,4-beta-mannosidase